MANEEKKTSAAEKKVEEEKKPVVRFVTDEEDEKIDLIETDDDDELPEDEEVTALTTVQEKNGVDRLNSGLSSFFKPGTPTCAIFGAAIGIGAAVLCLNVGFWPTVLLGLFAGVGAWIGGSGKGSLLDKVKKLWKH